MKLKKGLLSVVFLLATSSVMAAMSYSSASVTSDMSVSLVDTKGALLALEASENHNSAFYVSATAKVLKLDLSKGINSEKFGVQPFSVYEWDDLFKVTNNSENNVKVTIKTDKPINTGRVQILGSINGENWSGLSNIHKSPATGLTFNLASGDSKWIDIKTDSMNGHAVTTDFDLIVEAENIVAD